MGDSPLALDPQCLGAADVELVEQIFQRIMSDGPQYARPGGGRTLARSKVSSDSNSSNSNSNIYSNQIIVFPKSATDMKWKDSESHGHQVTSDKRRNSENRFSPRNRSAGPLVKRQIAMDCNLKSLPVHSKMWMPAGRAATLDVGEPGRVSQGQIILQPPNGAANPRKGLSGSKVRPVLLTHPVKQTKNSTGLDPASEQGSSVSASASPSPRPYSLKHRSRNSNVLVDEGEEQHGLVSHYRWNASEQGLRLRRQLTRLTSCRSMKRASEMIQHRLDPMYLMNGARLSLQNRYMIDDTEMHRLQEMTQMREGLMSDLKKMKFPYGARTSQQIMKDGQSRSDVETKAKGKDRSQDLKVSKAHFSTPASEPPLSEEHHRALSEHTDSEESLNGPA